ncbi:hypothetical protein AC579_1852 [Pseudocercospora musae]|uniref:Uncharacterized protein n=1 Tax=Pseudocercospora musae TaxID=113226 RepID=A0A139IBD7_9PEZI|nr:hypothetical protein AC579_1852 [Pseudocercospora musae]
MPMPMPMPMPTPGSQASSIGPRLEGTRRVEHAKWEAVTAEHIGPRLEGTRRVEHAKWEAVTAEHIRPELHATRDALNHVMQVTTNLMSDMATSVHILQPMSMPSRCLCVTTPNLHLHHFSKAARAHLMLPPFPTPTLDSENMKRSLERKEAWVGGARP